MSTVSSHAASSETVLPAKPSFLRRVRIRGYKSIAFCDVTLEPLTILVGRNASGKSNFLDVLAFLRDIVKVGVNEAVRRHGGAEAILCRTQEERVVSLELECEYPISDEADRWQATYRIDIDFPTTRSAQICRERLRIEQGEWWVGYTNEAGHVTCTAADDQARQRAWKVKDRPFLDACGDTPVPEFVEWLAGAYEVAYWKLYEAVTGLLAHPAPEAPPHPLSVLSAARARDEALVSGNPPAGDHQMPTVPISLPLGWASRSSSC